MNRHDREDLTAQREKLAAARTSLSAALAHLASTATDASRAANRKHGVPDLPAVYAACRAVERQEENLDLALLDLATAGGADA